MPRPLKTFVTSIGFYDLAVAAPSMKAALDAWGAGPNLFRQGFAKETGDPAIVSAAMAKPGVVLKRAVGTRDPFEEQAEPPKMLPMDLPRFAPKAKPSRAKPGKKKPAARKPDPDAERKAQAAFEKAQKLRDAERRREEAAREKERVRRKQAVEKAQAALERARARHQSALDAIERDRAALDKRAEAEESRWQKEENRLRDEVARAWRR
ncbi:MAG TPA: cell envelope biogenesis protein TolA [Rhizomicrobium sp.]|nr:cell envelope biogenesis protein TolA [Rhizomicrobium sp.]